MKKIKKMIYHVKNIHEKQDGNWFQYWKGKAQNTNNYSELCHVLGCPTIATDGAHVKLVDEEGNDAWYIVPLCHRHNCQFGKELLVTGPLVPVNRENDILL